MTKNDFLVMQKNSLYRKIRLISKWRSKFNQSVKLGQLLEYNMRNIFLEKSYSKYGEETFPRPFYKKNKIEHISGSIV